MDKPSEKEVEIPEYALVSFTERLYDMVQSGAMNLREAKRLLCEILDPLEEKHSCLCNRLHEMLIH
jgi:polyhydroxyalkanoate synthesis regulator phasin